ncbi:5-(carboxyamino)imidazole ribonucleotide synthase [Pantoea sp. Aalb]|uniref:5-(carboxyamino)imidazole ribonucleotide synthase n=1 Tax=Pantoea sp. Aalb TaxID=2576762 RepID=UPI0013234CBB|nr:5-(carboxyamino)imidazole ribonucleotide synthase [Pantoea sp. Aalb]MXP67565.1 5-(carboxyamino)imidazole ribonucleotide synthase [Pantoea sp. Aalb]
MQPICVLGNGQLGRMLCQAGQPLGLTVYTIGLDTKPTDLPIGKNIIAESIITSEVEYWPKNLLTNELSNHPSFINRDIFQCLADRLMQKKLLNKLNLSTAPWQLLSDQDEWTQIFRLLGELVIVKLRTGGYDGRGQWSIYSHETKTIPNKYYGKCIVEQNINFSNEVSLIGARGYDGKIVFYPLAYNLHQKGILCINFAFSKFNVQQKQAEDMLSKIMNHLNYVGVMAMECFITPTGLLINELAPRVHNSGHWTQNGASISQFELHLRALLGLPLPNPIVFASSVMINLIGTHLNLSWLKQPLVHLHWYNKEVRINRKMGHLNLVDIDHVRLSTALNNLISILPKEYASRSINWVIKHL